MEALDKNRDCARKVITPPLKIVDAVFDFSDLPPLAVACQRVEFCFHDTDPVAVVIEFVASFLPEIAKFLKNNFLNLVVGVRHLNNYPGGSQRL